MNSTYDTKSFLFAPPPMKEKTPDISLVVDNNSLGWVTFVTFSFFKTKTLKKNLPIRVLGKTFLY